MVHHFSFMKANQDYLRRNQGNTEAAVHSLFRQVALVVLFTVLLWCAEVLDCKECSSWLHTQQPAFQMACIACCGLSCPTPGCAQAMTLTLTNLRDQMGKYSLGMAGEYLARACLASMYLVMQCDSQRLVMPPVRLCAQAMTLTNVRDQMDKYSLETAGEYLARACADEAPVRSLLARHRNLQQVYQLQDLPDVAKICIPKHAAR